MEKPLKAEHLYSHMVELRRKFHRHPELSLADVYSAKVVHLD